MKYFYLLLIFLSYHVAHAQGVVSAPVLEGLTAKSNATELKMAAILAKLNAREVEMENALKKLRRATYIKELNSVRNAIYLIETSVCSEINVQADLKLLNEEGYELCGLTQKFENTMLQIEIVVDLIQSALLDKLEMNPSDRIQTFDDAVEQYARATENLRNLNITLDRIIRMLRQQQRRQEMDNSVLSRYF